jgi:hypothetical protein
MRDVAVVIGIAALIALAGWLVGSLALRIAGVLMVIAGLVGTATGRPEGLLVAAIGLLAWIAGHWLYGARHHYFVSPLARRVFQQASVPADAIAPRRSDPPLGRPHRRRRRPPQVALVHAGAPRSRSYALGGSRRVCLLGEGLTQLI